MRRGENRELQRSRLTLLQCWSRVHLDGWEILLCGGQGREPGCCEPMAQPDRGHQRAPQLKETGDSPSPPGAAAVCLQSRMGMHSSACSTTSTAHPLLPPRPYLPRVCFKALCNPEHLLGSSKTGIQLPLRVQLLKFAAIESHFL